MSDQKQSMLTMATSSSELLQPQAELWCHTFGYLKSMALYSAVKLGIPTAIHRCGGGATLSDLLAAVPLHPSKQHYLPRLMATLAAAGIFAADDGDAPFEGETAARVYRLTPVSRLLVDDAASVVDRASLSRFVLMAAMPFHVAASVRLHQWLQSDDEVAAAETPFMMAHGKDYYGAAAGDPELNAVFNQGMVSDSEFVSELVVRECGDVFAGITSLVDVGGGTGATAAAIAKAFPHVKCSVLELPQVVDSISPNGLVEFVSGDMMEFIPPADAVLLKFVLHNWTDEDCVKIMERSREAVSQGARPGKVIIIDTVVASPSQSQQVLEAQALMDMCMMVLTTGKERREQHWHQIFAEAGFSRYKIYDTLGVRSVIEVYL